MVPAELTARPSASQPRVRGVEALGHRCVGGGGGGAQRSLACCLPCVRDRSVPVVIVRAPVAEQVPSLMVDLFKGHAACSPCGRLERQGRLSPPGIWFAPPGVPPAHRAGLGRSRLSVDEPVNYLASVDRRPVRKSAADVVRRCRWRAPCSPAPMPMAPDGCEADSRSGEGS